jgi:hypothetical protein
MNKFTNISMSSQVMRGEIEKMWLNLQLDDDAWLPHINEQSQTHSNASLHLIFFCIVTRNTMKDILLIVCFFWILD